MSRDGLEDKLAGGPQRAGKDVEVTHGAPDPKANTASVRENAELPHGFIVDG